VSDLCVPISMPDLFKCRRCKCLTPDPAGHERWHGTVDSATVPDDTYVAAGLTYCAECNSRLTRGHAPGCSLDKANR